MSQPDATMRGNGPAMQYYFQIVPDSRGLYPAPERPGPRAFSRVHREV
jgi:hypothetical protein